MANQQPADRESILGSSTVTKAPSRLRRILVGGTCIFAQLAASIVAFIMMLVFMLGLLIATIGVVTLMNNDYEVKRTETPNGTSFRIAPRNDVPSPTTKP